MSTQPFNSDGGFSTAGNVTANTVALSNGATLIPGFPGYPYVANMATLVGENTYISSTDGTSWVGVETGVPAIGVPVGNWTFGVDGNLTTPGSSGNISGVNTISTGNINLTGRINGGTATVVTDGINSIALAPGAQMDVYAFPFSQTTRGQLTISGVTTPAEVNGTWYYQSVSTNAYQIYTDSTYSTLVNASGWSAYTGGGEVAITKQIPAANIVINSNGYLSTFNTTGGLDLPGSLGAVGDIGTDGNIYANYFVGNGSQLTGVTVSGSDPVSTTGNVSGGNLIATGTVSASGNITAGNISANNIGNIASLNLNGNASTVLYGNGVFAAVAGGGTYGNSNVATFLAAFGSNTVSTTGTVTAGNITGGNVLTGGVISATSNITGGNIRTAGQVSATGNITADIIAAGNNGNGTNFKVGDDAWIGDINSADTIGIRGQQNAANGYIVFGNVDNSTKLGRAGAGPLTYNSNVSLTYTPATGTGAGITTQGANTNGGTGYFDFLKATNQSGGSTNPNKWFRVNSTGAFEIINSAYTATLFSIADNGNTVVQGNLQVTGNLTYVNTTNLTVTNALITLANAATTPAQANGGGIQLNGANANILYGSGNDSWNINKTVAVTGAVTATTTMSAAGNITGGNVLTGGLISSTGTITGSSLLGTVASLSGNVTGGNVLTAGVVSATGNVTGNYVLGNGALLTGVITSVANINSGTSNITVVSSGGNITVGVGGTSNVAVFATTGEYVTGVVSASGNVTGGNVLTGGIVSSTGNITGGNLSGTSIAGTLTTAAQTNITSVGTLGALTVTANVTGGNVLTTGIMSSTGNATHGNILTAGLVSATANVTGGNITTAGLISATGNITGGNISATNHTGTTVSITGNITAGNVINTGISSVTGNITAGNVLTGGVVSATGNITTANSFVGNLAGTTVSATGNVYTNNIIANNVIINGQSTTYGTVTPAYMVVGLTTTISGFGVGSTVILDTVVGNTNSQTSYNASTGVFTLTAGVTYDLSFTPSFISFTNTTGGFMCYEWVDATTNTALDSTGTGIGTGVPNTETSSQQDNLTARVIYKPTTNQTVKLRVTSANGTVNLRGGLGTQVVIKPLNPAIAVQAANPVGFRATTPVTNVSVNNGASATMLFGTEEVDTNSVYDPATGRFTPNIAGYYSVSWFIVTSANGANELLVTLNKNGTDIAWSTNVTTATAHWNGVGGSAGMIYLNGTTDYILVKLTNNSGSTATVYSGSLSYFSAYLIR